MFHFRVHNGRNSCVEKKAEGGGAGGNFWRGGTVRGLDGGSSLLRTYPQTHCAA